MLQKVRARHGIDLPVEHWPRAMGFGSVITALALLFIALPLVAGLVRAVRAGFGILPAIGLGTGLLTLVGIALALPSPERRRKG